VLAGSAVPDDDWTAPGAHEVTAGVYRMPLPLPNDGLRAVNVYAILAGADVVLVDSGWAITEARAQLEAGLKSLGAALVDVGGFLVTHLHRDHYSQAVHVRREFGTAVSLGVGERAALDQLTDPAHRALSGHLSALRQCGGASVADALAAQSPEPHDPHASGWVYPDTWLRDGDSVRCAPSRCGRHSGVYPGSCGVPRVAGRAVDVPGMPLKIGRFRIRHRRRLEVDS